MPIKPRTKKPTLLQFGDYLEGLHERQKKWRKKVFNISRWKDTQDCRTHACAIGWGIIEKQLPGMGFGPADLPKYMGNLNCYAIANYFKITRDEAISLFTNDFNLWSGRKKITALDVSKSIKKFLKKEKK